MPIEYPSEELLNQYQSKLETETVKEFKSNGNYKTPYDEFVFTLGFREGFTKAKQYFFQLVCIK